jgi:hypothetical protein
MPRILLSLDVNDMLALPLDHYQNKSTIPTNALMDTLTTVLANVENTHGNEADLVRLDFLADGSIYVLTKGEGGKDDSTSPSNVV